MDVMEPAPPLPPPPPIDDRCYRHPDRVTGVHSTRCGRAICPDCMVPAPVGHQCPACAGRNRQEVVRPARPAGAAGGAAITRALLLVLAAVFAIEVARGGPNTLMNGPNPRGLFDMGGALGYAIAAGQYWRMFTSMFLHIGIIHILMNSYALFIFGNVIETEQGHRRYLVALLTTGLAASAASYAFGSPGVVSAGASGAIFGLFGMFLGQAWRRRNMAFYAARVRSAMTMILLNAFLAISIPAIDWRAHLGGLVAGVAIGYTGEGSGDPGTRRRHFALAVAFVAIATVALTVWRTAQLTPQLHQLGII